MTIRRSLVLTFVERNISLLIFFATTLVVSRILTPQEFGLFAMALGVVGIAQALREAGVGIFLVQAETLDQAMLRAAFTVALILSFGCAALLAGIAPLAADFFKEPAVRELILVMAAGFLPVAISASVSGTLQRAMRFRSLFVINLSASTVYAVMALTLVIGGAGVMGLAWAMTASAFVHALVCLPFAGGASRFVPGVEGIGRIVRYSGAASVSIILHEVSERSFNLIVGRILGAAALGLYFRAHAMVGLFGRVLDSVHPVLLPAFAQLKRKGDDVSGNLLKGVSLLSGLSLAVYGFFSLVGEPALVFLYGSQWGEAGVLVAPLCLALSVGFSIDRLAIPTYIAFGRIDLTILPQLLLTPFKAVVIFLGAQHSLLAATWSLVSVTAVACLIHIILLSRVVPVSTSALARRIAHSVLMVLPALAVGAVARELADTLNANAFLTLLSVGVLFTIVWTGMIWWSKHPLAEESVSLLRQDPRSSPAYKEPYNV
ncbi:MAG: oligosaccharide flippase family protein [Pseudomonadota bacterium]